MVFDADNGNTNWKGAEILEINQIYNFSLFNSLGPDRSACISSGHIKIQVHIIYNYKQDGRYKAHMVASGNMTGTNLDTYYSIVVSLHSVRTVVFLSELNNIDIRNSDIINAYLTALTTKKNFFKTGPEFAPFEHSGHLLLIKTAL